jgi:hypothetical protein
LPAEDIIWLLLRKEFLSEKDLKLFAVWCARESLKLIENPDERIVEACNVAERYANKDATKDEILAAHDAAYTAANAIADHDTATYHIYNAAYYASYAAYYSYYTADAAYVVSTDASIAAVYAVFYTYYASDADNDNDANSALANAYEAVYAATRASQLDQLLTYFK